MRKGKQGISMVIDKNELEKNAKAWVASKKGQESILEVLQHSREMTTRLREARDIDPKTLHEPFTV